MKTIRRIMALALVLCMATALGVWKTDAHADWYTVQFNKLDNRTFEDIPTGVTLTTTAAAPASSADTPASATAGAAADPQKPGQLEWFYNPWAGTLVIRGKGAMVGFDEKHPAPWHNESKRALRVIIDEGVTTISNEAFKDFIYLRSVVFPSTLKGISATAFEKCEKLKRVEVVTEIKDAEKLIEASKSKELLMDDVKIIRVTKEAVRREICWLTTYWWCRVEIYRDKAGRPIRIIEHKYDGSVIDTGIKYLNEATAVNEAKDPDTAERLYSVRTYPSGAKTAVETEKDEYGRNLIKGDYDLNKNGRQVSGTETTLYGETGLSSEKRTLENATYNDNGTGTKYWTEVQSNGNTKAILEKVDKNDKILSVETVTYDRNGLVISTALTENTYNQDGNKTRTSSVEVNNEGKTLSEETTSYTYSGKKLTGMTTEAQYASGNSTKTEKSFSYDKDGNLATETETVSNVGSLNYTTSTVTSYTYTDTGLKKSATIVETFPNGSTEVTEKKYDKYERPETEKTVEMDKNGNITATSEKENGYNSEHVRSDSIETTINADGSKSITVSTYDSDGRLLTVSTVTTDAQGKTTSSSTESRTYNGDGKLTSNKIVETNEEGKTKTNELKTDYDAQGRALVSHRTKTDYDGTTTVSNTNRSFDARGRIVKEIKETVNPDGTKAGTVTTYTYHEDGSYDETTTPIEEAAVLAAKPTDSSEETAGTSTSATAPEGSNVLADTSLNAQPSEESQVSAGNEVTEPETENKEQEAKKEKEEGDTASDTTQKMEASEQEQETVSSEVVDPDAEGKTQEGKAEDIQNTEDGVVNMLSATAAGKNLEEDNTVADTAKKTEEEGEQDAGDDTLKSLSTGENEDQEENEESHKNQSEDGEDTGGIAMPMLRTLMMPPPATMPVASEDVHVLEGDLNVKTPPTCGTEGKGTRHCSVCEQEIEVTIPATGVHTFEGDVTVIEPATCGAEGRGTQHCSVCDRDIEVTIPATGEHNYQSAETQAPTCTTEGIRTFTCVCGASYTESIPKTEHQYVRTQTTATCTDGGTETWTCVCGDSFTKDVDAYGHSFGDMIVDTPPATCKTPGIGHRVCSICQASSSPETITVSHSFGEPYENENGERVHQCSVCQTVEPVPAA